MSHKDFDDSIDVFIEDYSGGYTVEELKKLPLHEKKDIILEILNDPDFDRDRTE